MKPIVFFSMYKANLGSCNFSTVALIRVLFATVCS